MYCPKCGQEVGDYTRICPSCGELLEDASSAVQQPQTGYSQPQPDNPTDAAQQPQQNSNSYSGQQPGQNYSNPGYQPSPDMPVIPDYKVQSILLIVFSSVLCCVTCMSLLALPFAITALVYSNKIKTYISMGDIALAREASRKTKMWCWVSFGILIGAIVISIIFAIVYIRSGYYKELMDELFRSLPYEYDFDFDY